MLVLAVIAAFASAADSTLLKPPESVRIAIPKVAERPVLDGKLDEKIFQLFVVVRGGYGTLIDAKRLNLLFNFFSLIEKGLHFGVA